MPGLVSKSIAQIELAARTAGNAAGMIRGGGGARNDRFRRQDGKLPDEYQHDGGVRSLRWFCQVRSIVGLVAAPIMAWCLPPQMRGLRHRPPVGLAGAGHWIVSLKGAKP